MIPGRTPDGHEGVPIPVAVGPEFLDPMATAIAWLPGNEDPDRPQVTLSTTGLDGAPNARTVLMTEVAPEGFYFHTDAHSRKVEELRRDPRCAITMLWPGFTRQLVLQGVAEPAPPEEIAAAYARRSPYLRQLAWQNSAEFALLSDEERRALWAAFAREHAEGMDQPDRWTGFLVRPVRMVFWTSSSDTASRREEYTLVEGGWQHARLAG